MTNLANTQLTELVNLETLLQGEISGQIAIGNHILQIGSMHGGVVNFITSDQRPTLRERPVPVILRPRPFRGLLDRQAEVEAAIGGLQSGLPVELYGVEGLGKTSLLRHLAYHPSAAESPDGVVFLSARSRSPEDLLQSLFDAFCESDAPYKASEAQIRIALDGKEALILLDDVILAREELDSLLDVAPNSRFLLASLERRLWREGRPLALGGLPKDDALTLLERELGRTLAPSERRAAEAVWAALNGHPLHILQAAALAREQGHSLGALARDLKRGTPLGLLVGEFAMTLPEPEQRVLSLLSALKDAAVNAAHIAALTGLPEAGQALERLEKRGLVKSAGSGYSVMSNLGRELRRAWGDSLNPWIQNALTFFTAWAEEQRRAPERLMEGAEAILPLLERATELGHWREVLSLARATEGALALTGWWGAWAQVLQSALLASQAVGDRAAEAWALHQLGTRSLGLQEAAQARQFLGEALRIREGLGDRVGAAISRHNLDTFLSPPPPPQGPPGPRPGPRSFGSALAKASIRVVTLATAGLVGGFGVFLGAQALSLLETTPMPEFQAPVASETAVPSATSPPERTEAPPATSEPSATPSLTPSFTPTPTASFTPTPTASLTPTATLGPPMATGDLNSNCRYGPSQVYDVIGFLLEGQTAPIEGRSADWTWWWIKNPGGNGHCWVWDGLVRVSGDTSGVPVITPPPTPTTPPTETPTPTQTADARPPSVGIWHSPSGKWKPTEKEVVSFTAKARDDTGVARIEIWVAPPGKKAQRVATCTKVSKCAYSGGPYPSGQLTYEARAWDAAGNRGRNRSTIVIYAVID